MRNVIHDLHMVDYKKSALPNFSRTIEIVYGVLIVVISAWKLFVQYRGIVRLDNLYTERDEFSWSQFNDILWVIFVVVMPWIKAIVEVISPRALERPDQLLQVSIRIARRDPCPCCTDIP